MEALQEVIHMQVLTSEITLKSKCWWTKELTQLQVHANKLGRASFKLRHILEHQVHREHKEAKGEYQRVLQKTKQQHWRDWLEKAEDLHIWAANQVIATPSSDGGKAKILKLKHKVREEETTASTNEEKSTVLAKSFFPTKPQEEPQPTEKFPKACKGAGRITREQIQTQLKSIKPYKAPGPNGIPNIAISKCADLIVDRLFYIFKAMFERKLLYDL
jgi:hypothetical protein